MATAPAPGRNAPCHCGSGLKYKRCCWAKDQAAIAAVIPKRAAAPAPAPEAPVLPPLPPLDAPDPVPGTSAPLPDEPTGANFNTLMLIAALSAVAGVLVALFSSAANGLLVFGVGVVAAVLWYARRPPPPRANPPQA